MNTPQNDFKQAFIIESSLLVVFLLASLCYVANLIPEKLLIPVLGTIVILGLIPVAKSALESLRAKDRKSVV